MSRIDYSNAVNYFEKLCKIADTEGQDTLSFHKQVIVLVWWAKALVDNGGFQYFYEGTTYTESISNAFDEIGLEKIGDAFRKSNEILFRGEVISKQKQDETLSEISENEIADLEKLNQIIWDVDEDELFRKLINYTVTHEKTLSYMRI